MDGPKLNEFAYRSWYHGFVSRGRGYFLYIDNSNICNYETN